MAKQTLIARIRSNARGELKSGSTKLALINESIDCLDCHGDWTNLAWLVSLASASDKGRVKRIIEAACGVTFKSDPKQPSGLRAVMPEPVEVSEGDNEWNGRAILAAFVRKGVSFRAKALENGQDDIPALLVSREKTIDIDAIIKRAVTVADDEGMSTAEIVALVRFHCEAIVGNAAA